MKNRQLVFLTVLQSALCLLVTSSCCRQPGEVWDDTKSCGRHIGRGLKTLVGCPSTSRLVHSKDEFICYESPIAYDDQFQECGYISMPVEYNGGEMAFADAIPQPRETPGDYNSSVPGIDAFRDPTTLGHLSQIFSNIHFEYNSNLVKGQENLAIIQAAANYLNAHPNVYVFLEGNCDERGPAAYNLALGSRRSNAVRTALVQNGVDGDRLFTISYGSERPLMLDFNEDAWAKNRRVEFKIYQR